MGMIKSIMHRAKKKIELDPSNWLKYDESGLPTGFTRKGKAIGWGLVGAGTINAASDQRQQNSLGKNMGVVTPTPSYAVYNQRATDIPGGADGSLVFALDRTKNGGYL